MIHIIITSYGEPKATKLAITKFLNQKNVNQKYKIIVADPFPEVEEMIVNEFPEVEYFEDPERGKSYILNIILKKLFKKDEIIIMTDGDVFVSENAVSEILKKFEDSKVGVVCGRPVSLNKRDNMFGYWSHFLMDIGAHEISRKKRYLKGEFLEATGYLFAIRNGVVKEFPCDIAEDTTLPYLFFKKGFSIAYAEDAKVYVKWPDNMKDWLKQKKRAADAHSKLRKYYPDFPKVKSFFNEILEGSFSLKVWKYPRNFKEFIWTIWLYPTRLYMWLSLFFDLKVRKKEYKDGWREDLAVESTRTLD